MLRKIFTIVLLITLVQLIACSLRPAPRFYTESEPEKKVALTRQLEEENQSGTSALVEKFKPSIQKFWKAPYKWGGDTPSGTDCSGMIATIYRETVGLSLPHSAVQQYRGGSPVNLKDLSFGDLVFFNNGNHRGPDHVGLYIGSGYFLHATVSQGVILSKISKSPWNRWYVGARRYLKQESE